LRSNRAELVHQTKQLFAVGRVPAFRKVSGIYSCHFYAWREKSNVRELETMQELATRRTFKCHLPFVVRTTTAWIVIRTVNVVVLSGWIKPVYDKGSQCAMV
jgi:hypothetical protein